MPGKSRGHDEFLVFRDIEAAAAYTDIEGALMVASLRF